MTSQPSSNTMQDAKVITIKGKDGRKVKLTEAQWQRKLAALRIAAQKEERRLWGEKHGAVCTCEKPMYQMYGRWYEDCRKCGKQHPEIYAWKLRLEARINVGDKWTIEPHPYMWKVTRERDGYPVWNEVDYKRAMRPGKKIIK